MRHIFTAFLLFYCSAFLAKAQTIDYLTTKGKFGRGNLKEELQKIETEERFDLLKITDEITKQELFSWPPALGYSSIKRLEKDKWQIEGYTDLYFAGKDNLVLTSSIAITLVNSSTFHFSKPRKIVLPCQVESYRELKRQFDSLAAKYDLSSKEEVFPLNKVGEELYDEFSNFTCVLLSSTISADKNRRQRYLKLLDKTESTFEGFLGVHFTTTKEVLLRNLD